MKFIRCWKWTALGIAALIAIAAFRLLSAETGPLPVVSMKAGAGWFSAEVAATEESIKNGLMFRQFLDEHAGMLFSFEKTEKHCMWMRNTLIPLSVAWLDAHGVILGIQNMAANSDDQHCSATPASYALEVNKGAFERQGIAVGMKFL